METLTFKTETARLLDLVVHSLYTRHDVFLRELITNAADALDRLRFEALTRPELVAGDGRLDIRLEVDPAARTLTVRDNGIGMSRADVIDHIGTIARSGTQEFVARLRDRGGRDEALALIGRFGVGFYSCFMVADQVTMTTRRADEEVGTRWESTGDVEYTVDDAPGAARGTAVTLQLKAADLDGGIEDYTDRFVLSRIVKQYADFVPHPIVFVAPSESAPADGGAEPQVNAPAVLNSMKPIWTRRASDVTAEEYEGFYKHLTNDWNSPLLRMSFKAEGRWEYSALVFVPDHAPFDLYYHGVTYGLQLYSNRLLIVQNCTDLVPRYLRFVKGVVDAGDLPLNVSRQSLQDAHHLAAIRRWLAHKIVGSFSDLRAADPRKYEALWRAFGRALKEGVSEDAEQRARLTPLLLFESSHHPTALTSLADYVSRMKPDQREIFFVSGESRQRVERSPHVEALRARDYEVLYFVEPVDELVAQALGAFDGKPLRSAGKGQLELGDAEERADDTQASRFEPLLERVKAHLDGRVRGVRLSRRLTISPACLAGDEFGFSPHIERLLAGTPKQQRTLELNPGHPVIARLADRVAGDRHDPLIAAAAEVLLGSALLAEGSNLPESALFNERVIEVLAGALDAPARAAASR